MLPQPAGPRGPAVVTPSGRPAGRRIPSRSRPGPGPDDVGSPFCIRTGARADTPSGLKAPSALLATADPARVGAQDLARPGENVDHRGQLAV
jgi:hypothetical protein